MKILAIGDIVGTKSIEYLSEKLPNVRAQLSVDVVVANGENATDIHGLSAPDAKKIHETGVDVITLGNHTYGRKDLCDVLSHENWIVRPANYPPLAPGAGYTVLTINGWRMLCMNVQGTALMESLACPFATVDRILQREEGNYDFAILDIHAEATSEKIALGRYFDGRVHVMFGTHTHVQTADEQILPRGSGYITDIGMTGPCVGVIGSNAEDVIEKFRTKMPVRFKVADGDVTAHGALFDLDTDTMKVVSVKRVKF